MTNLDSILKSRDITLPTKVHLVKAMVFPVVIYGCESWLDYKESWAPKNWCFWTVVLETLKSPLDSKKNKPVNPKGNQSWIFIGRIDAEAETLILWPPNAKNWLIWKDPDAGKDWSRRRRGRQMASPTQWTSLSKLWESVMDRKAWHAVVYGGSQKVGHDWATELNWG